MLGAARCCRGCDRLGTAAGGTNRRLCDAGPRAANLGPEAPSPAKPTHRPDKPAREPLFLPTSGPQPSQHDFPRSSDRRKHANAVASIDGLSVREMLGLTPRPVLPTVDLTAKCRHGLACVVLDRRVVHGRLDVGCAARDARARRARLGARRQPCRDRDARRFDGEEMLRGELEALRSLSAPPALVTVVEPRR